MSLFKTFSYFIYWFILIIFLQMWLNVNSIGTGSRDTPFHWWWIFICIGNKLIVTHLNLYTTSISLTRMLNWTGTKGYSLLVFKIDQWGQMEILLWCHQDRWWQMRLSISTMTSIEDAGQPSESAPVSEIITYKINCIFKCFIWPFYFVFMIA